MGVKKNKQIWIVADHEWKRGTRMDLLAVVKKEDRKELVPILNGERKGEHKPSTGGCCLGGGIVLWHFSLAIESTK